MLQPKMRSISKALLAAEVAICFAPMAFAVLWMCAVMAVPFLMMLHGGGYEGWDEWTRGLVPFVAAFMGCTALVAMLSFIFGDVRLLAVSTMTICSLAGLLSLVVEMVDHRTWDAESVAFLVAPFLCGLHLLYLGRSYFSSASK